MLQYIGCAFFFGSFDRRSTRMPKTPPLTAAGVLQHAFIAGSNAKGGQTCLIVFANLRHLLGSFHNLVLSIGGQEYPEGNG